MEPRYEPRRRAWGLVSRQLRPRLETFFADELGRPDLIAKLPRFWLFQDAYSRHFLRLLGELAQAQGKQVLLEKTPEHLFHIDYIERVVSAPRFIHLLRQGTDVIASLYEVTHRHPRWWGGAWDLDTCIDRWLESIAISQCHSHRPNHVLIQYEQLIAAPEPHLAHLFHFMDLPLDPTALQNYNQVAQQITLDKAGRSVKAAIDTQPSRKFQTILSLEQQHHVQDRIAHQAMPPGSCCGVAPT